jgi:hypothetical protein
MQRFGAGLNLNLHFHALVLDGAYTLASPLAHPVFHEAPRLRDRDVLELVLELHARILRVLAYDVRSGVELESEVPVRAGRATSGLVGAVAPPHKHGCVAETYAVGLEHPARDLQRLVRWSLPR